MKKILLSSGVVMLFALGAQAQTEFGLKAGLNFPTYGYGDPDALSTSQSITSFCLTGYIDARIVRGFHIHPEVSLQGKGAHVIKSEVLGGGEITQRTKWLDIPFNFLGKAPIGNVCNIFAGAGPYMGFAMNGENTYPDGSTSAVIIYKGRALKNTDYGINFLAGFQLWHRFSLNANYRFGLSNITYDTNNWSNNLKNRVFSVSIGVSLAGLK